MKEEGKLTLAYMGLVLLAIVAIAGSVIGHGIALSVLWRWFIVPIFALPTLTMWQAYGIALTFSALSGHTEAEKSADGSTPEVIESVGKIIAIAVIHPAALLVIGWIVRSLM